MGESLAAGNTAIALLANALATGCMLYAIITVLGPISDASKTAIRSSSWQKYSPRRVRPHPSDVTHRISASSALVDTTLWPIEAS